MRLRPIPRSSTTSASTPTSATGTNPAPTTAKRTRSGAVLRPGLRLMRRLTLAQKLAVTATALLVPLPIVGWAYLDTQSSQIDFSAKERDGVTYLAPASELVSELVAARSAVAAGDPAPDLGDAVDAVRRAEQADGAAFSTSDAHAALADAVAAIDAGSGDRADLVEQYDTAIAAALSLVTKISDGSNLTLDPDLDSYYLMDTLVFRLPALSDVAGRLSVLSTEDQSDPSVIREVGVATALLESNLDTIESNYAIARSTSADPAVAEHADDVEALLVTGRDLAGESAATSSELSGRTVGLGADLSEALTPTLDGLLDTRIGGFESNRTRSLATTGVALAIALYLLWAFRAATTRQVEELSDTLDALGRGDLTQRIAAEHLGRDELGRVCSTLNEALAGLGTMIDSVASSAQTLAAASEELTAVSTELGGSAVAGADRASAASSAASDVDRHLDEVVLGHAEMGLAVDEIARAAAEAAAVAGRAVVIAGDTSATVETLATSSNEISDVVALISAIAEQTNLLALNATIEAARAGEFGKGFAVVAREVKDLAQETAKATDDITRRVEAIQHDTGRATAAIGEITTIVRDIADAQATIAAAVEEQTASTAEIARSVEQVAAGSSAISSSISMVAETTQVTTHGATNTQHAAHDLATLAADLDELVGSFRY